VIPEIHFNIFNSNKHINRYGITQIIAYTLISEEHQIPEDPNIEAVWLN